MPIKYLGNDPSWVKAIGPIHGVLFVLFVFNALGVGVEQKWGFFQTTWKALLASMIPFGTFYLDYTLLRNIHAAEKP